MSARLAVESLAARAASKLSRIAGAGGGTTLPGKLLWKLDPGAIDALAARLRDGAAVVSATNGKTTTTAMAAEILEPGRRLAWNRSGANLVSGVASTLLAERDADLGLLEVDEGALPEVVRRDQAPCGAARQPLPRPARSLRRARAHRRALARRDGRAAAGDRARGQRRRPPGRRPGARAHERDRLRDRRPPARPPRAPARGRLALLRPLRAARTSSRPRMSAISATTAVPPAAMPGPSCRFARRRSSSTGCTRRRSCSRRPPARPASGCRFPASTTSTTRSEPPRSRSRSARRSRRSVPASSGSAPRSAASSAFRRATRRVLVLLIKNPAGANEVVHTLLEGGAPSLLLVALNDAIADGKDVSWIWDVDFEPLLGRSERLIASGDRAAELGAALRLRRAAGRRARGGAVARPRARPRARADRRRRRARRPPHVHGDARAAADRRRARLVEAVLGAHVKIRVGHLYPEYLNIYADRGNIAVLSRRAALRGHELDVDADLRRRRRPTRARTTSSTSAAARTASRR